LFGNPGQVVTQLVAVLTVIFYSGTMSYVLLKVISLVMPLRAEARDESTGLDVTQHGEEAYVHAEGSNSVLIPHAAQ
jgi:Amt family ammonium transporter